MTGSGAKRSFAKPLRSLVQFGQSRTSALLLELGGSFNEQITFDASASGTLKLDHSVDFKGILSGFGGNDAIDLGDILAATASLNYTANAAGTGGTLTVNDGVHTAGIAFAGQYAASDFHIASVPETTRWFRSSIRRTNWPRSPDRRRMGS